MRTEKPAFVYSPDRPYYFENALTAKVAARNRLNKILNEFHAEMIEAFRPFLGQKIIKATDGAFVAKVKEIENNIAEKYRGPKNADGFRSSFLPHIYVSISDYSFRYVIRVDNSYPTFFMDGRSSGSGTVSAEESCYIGDLQGGQILTKLYDANTTRRTDFSAEKVIETRERLTKAKKVVSDIEGELSGFGEYDR